MDWAHHRIDTRQTQTPQNKWRHRSWPLPQMGLLAVTNRNGGHPIEGENLRETRETQPPFDSRLGPRLSPMSQERCVTYVSGLDTEVRWHATVDEDGQYSFAVAL
jgi:hypothetical protein